MKTLLQNLRKTQKTTEKRLKKNPSQVSKVEKEVVKLVQKKKLSKTRIHLRKLLRLKAALAKYEILEKIVKLLLENESVITNFTEGDSVFSDELKSSISGVVQFSSSNQPEVFKELKTLSKSIQKRATESKFVIDTTIVNDELQEKIEVDHKELFAILTTLVEEYEVKVQLDYDDFARTEKNHEEGNNELPKAVFKIHKHLLEIPFSEIKLGEKIGQGGSNAAVYKATWNGARCAVKIFTTSFLYDDGHSFKEFEHEVSILSSIRHPHIIEFYGLSSRPPRVGFVTEYCALPLTKAVEEDERLFRVLQKIETLKQIALSICYLHSRKIIHRDIKCENVLLTDDFVVKLIDFGTCKLMSSYHSTAFVKGIGTSQYVAPEMSLQETTYNEKVDSFSFAIVCWEVCHNSMHPYGEDAKMNFIEKKVASNDDFRPKINMEKVFKHEKVADKVVMEELEFLMRRNWNRDPIERDSFVEIIEVLTKLKEIMISKKSKTDFSASNLSPIRENFSIGKLERETQNMDDRMNNESNISEMISYDAFNSSKNVSNIFRDRENDPSDSILNVSFDDDNINYGKVPVDMNEDDVKENRIIFDQFKTPPRKQPIKRKLSSTKVDRIKEYLLRNKVKKVNEREKEEFYQNMSQRVEDHLIRDLEREIENEKNFNNSLVMPDILLSPKKSPKNEMEVLQKEINLLSDVSPVQMYRNRKKSKLKNSSKESFFSVDFLSSSKVRQTLTDLKRELLLSSPMLEEKKNNGKREDESNLRDQFKLFSDMKNDRKINLKEELMNLQNTLNKELLL